MTDEERDEFYDGLLRPSEGKAADAMLICKVAGWAEPEMSYLAGYSKSTMERYMPD